VLGHTSYMHVQLHMQAAKLDLATFSAAARNIAAPVNCCHNCHQHMLLLSAAVICRGHTQALIGAKLILALHTLTVHSAASP
jgi:hypothetical protein